MNWRFYLLLCSILFVLFSCGSSASLEQQQALYNQGQKEQSLAMASDLLSSGDPDVQIQALRFISKVHDTKAGEEVVDLFDSPSLQVQNQAIITAGEIHYAPAKDKLLGYIFTNRPSRKAAVIRSYQSIGAKGVQPLITKWETTSDPAKKKVLLSFIKKIGAASADAIILSFKDNALEENKEKIQLLVQFHSPVVAAVLLEHISEENIVHSVSYAIQAMGNDAINPLIAALQKLHLTTTDKKQLAKQARIIFLLGEIKATKAIPLLTRYTYSPDLILQARAHQALKKIRGYS